MRTNIEIDDELMDIAMRAGPYKTKKDAVEAGLKLLARQAAYREVLKWRGKLHWEGDESIDWTKPRAEVPVGQPAQGPTGYGPANVTTMAMAREPSPAIQLTANSTRPKAAKGSRGRR